MAPDQRAVYDSVVDGRRGLSSPFQLTDASDPLVGPFAGWC